MLIAASDAEKGELAKQRDAISTRLAHETERLKLVHQAQVEALFARHREQETGLRDRLADGEARLGELDAQVSVKVRELDEVRLVAARLEERAAHLAARNGQLEAEHADSLREVARLGEQLRVQAQEVAQARFDRGEAEARVTSLMRAAKAREAMLQEAAEEARIQGRLAADREATRADQLAARAAALAEVIRQSAGSTRAGARATLSLLLDDQSAPNARAQSVESAVSWLAECGGAAMKGRVSAAFEGSSGVLWTDETFISAAYRWLLGRPVDDQGLRHYGLMLRSRMTRRELLIDLARSQEALSRVNDGTAVRGLEDRQFVMAAYGALLDRGADTGGLEHYLAKLDAGTSRASVLIDLSRSAESREAATPIGSAIRAIWQLSRQRGRARQLVERWLLRRLPVRQEAWRAGRLAVLECDAALARQGLDDRIGDIGRLIESRVAAARAAASVPEAMPTLDASEISNAAPVVAEPAGAQGENALVDSSAGRTPAQIVGLIRSEIKQLDLV